MKIGILVAFLIIAGAGGTIFVLPQMNREPVADSPDVGAVAQATQEKVLPDPLNPAWPEEIAQPRNACANLQVPPEIQAQAAELREQKEKAEHLARELLGRYQLPREIFRGDPSRKAVALTIDTGTGGADGMEQILELGRHYNISFTFFLTGCWVLENPELTQNIAGESHGIANHTLTHLNLGSATDAQARREIAETQRILGEVLGWKPALFRKPQYAGGERVVNLLAEYDMISVQGFPDYGDTLGWRERATGNDVARLVKRKTAPGAIWVLHNLSLADLHALEEIIRFHLLEGYEILPVEEMLR